MSTTPTTPQWAEAMREEMADHERAGYTWNERDVFAINAAVFKQFFEQAIAHAPPLSPPTDEAKLREQVMDAVLTYIHAAYFNGGVRDPMFDANLITDRILTVLAPHLSQREPGDSELLDWLETTRRALFTRDSSGVVKFDAETSATDWRCVNAPTFRQAIKSAQRGEGKP